jgi:hypothetical protein
MLGINGVDRAVMGQGDNEGKEGEYGYGHGRLVVDLGIRNCCRVKNLGDIRRDPMAFCIGNCLLVCLFCCVLLFCVPLYRGARSSKKS